MIVYNTDKDIEDQLILKMGERLTPEVAAMLLKFTCRKEIENVCKAHGGSFHGIENLYYRKGRTYLTNTYRSSLEEIIKLAKKNCIDSIKNANESYKKLSKVQITDEQGKFKG